MVWPLSSQFSMMLQTPVMAFRDAEYKQATILRNPQGQPKPWAGAFAVVYKATLPSGKDRAIRVFSTESPERRERYEIVSRYVKQSAKLKCLVDFEYRENAIRAADGKWYPLVLMDWVEGDTLFKWVRNRVNERNVAAIRAAAECWVNVVKELEDARISHGDYQQSNIMVTPDGQMKLVDYDCMCVPELVGRRNLEIGVEPYQHPKRDGQTPLSLEIDRFSALMILIALRAVSADLSLWGKYVEKTQYDKLLFRREDIMEPNKSALIRDLGTSPDKEVAEFTGILLRAAQGNMQDVPQLREVVSPIRYVVPFLREGRWREAVEMLNRHHIVDIPANFRAQVDYAYEQAWKEKAWEEFQNLPTEISEKADRVVARVCNDAFLSYFQISPEVRQRAMEARERVVLLDRLAQMVQLSKQHQALSGEHVLASMADNFPKDYVYQHKDRVLYAKKLVKVVDALLKQMEKEIPDEIKISECWKEVIQIKGQNLLTQQQRTRAELAARRAPRLRTILGFSEKNMTPDQVDRQIISVWDESLFLNCPQAESLREMYNMAHRRLRKVELLQEAVDNNDRQQIITILQDPILQNYNYPGQLGMFVRNSADMLFHGHDMREAVMAGDREAFLANFDTRSFRAAPEDFVSVYPMVEKWIQEDILPRNVNGLRPPLGRSAITAGQNGVIILRWTWVQPRFSDVCVLGITSKEPQITDQPWEIPLLFQEEISRESWEKMGGFYALHSQRAWNGKNIVVWAIIDTGIRKYATEPLILGKLEEQKRSWFFRK
ncbi:MAG: hypothetical protein Q4C96_04855 [Planctomycetia bacterium]|nr:hypothetical protein [Planctomycetia bacterium]